MSRYIISSSKWKMKLRSEKVKELAAKAAIEINKLSDSPNLYVVSRIVSAICTSFGMKKYNLRIIFGLTDQNKNKPFDKKLHPTLWQKYDVEIYEPLPCSNKETTIGFVKVGRQTDRNPFRRKKKTEVDENPKKQIKKPLVSKKKKVKLSTKASKEKIMKSVKSR